MMCLLRVWEGAAQKYRRAEMAAEVRGLRGWEEYEEMLTVVAAGFGHEVEAVRRRFERHPPYQLENTRVTMVDGRIVSASSFLRPVLAQQFGGGSVMAVSGLG